MGRGWTSWNIPSLPVLDTARNGLLNVAGMDTLTALNRLPPITTRAGRRLRTWFTSDVLVPRPRTGHETKRARHASQEPLPPPGRRAGSTPPWAKCSPIRPSSRRTGMQPAELARLGRLEALCSEHRILPLRVYRGAAGNTRRYSPVKLPVVLDVERAVFVFVDPGYESAKALRSWGTAHRGLWKALREGCRPVGIVAVARTREGAAAGPDDTRQLDQGIRSIRLLRPVRSSGPPRDRPDRAGHPRRG